MYAGHGPRGRRQLSGALRQPNSFALNALTVRSALHPNIVHTTRSFLLVLSCHDQIAVVDKSGRTGRTFMAAVAPFAHMRPDVAAR